MNIMKLPMTLRGAVLALAFTAPWAHSVTVDVTVDKLALVYTDTSYVTEISEGTVQIGRLADSLTESSLLFTDRSAFDTFLADSASWYRYGDASGYVPGDLATSYTFTGNFEPFVKNYGSTTLPEIPYQVYVAVTSGTDHFGFFTFRGEGGVVGKFALTADDSPIFGFANEANTGGVLNLEVVGAYGAVRVADYLAEPAIDPAVALIPEPSTGTLLLGSLGLFLAISAARRAQQQKIF